MNISITFQNPYHFDALPDESTFVRWAHAAWQDQTETEIVIRIVDEQEIMQLNTDFRDTEKTTNVLTFPAPDWPAHILENQSPYAGDIVFCAPVIAHEASIQKKTDEQHWAHMTVHSILHLQGYDHIEEDEATEMETLEIALLATLGYPDPYADHPI